MSDGDYVLGTRDDEVERLGLQHRVWRERVIAAWDRAGIAPGHTVIDVGAGPGFATADLSERVGPAGKVVALERAPHFLHHLHDRALGNVVVHSHDVTHPFPTGDADASWCRWLLSFAVDPAAVVRNIAAALKRNGVAVFHEYAAYESFSLMPPDPRQERFRDLVVRSWRDGGGEPDAALRLPQWLHDAGLRIADTRTYADIVAPDEERWQWPRSFLATNARRLRELGYLRDAEVAPLATLLDYPLPHQRMLTPLVAEVLAVRC